MIKQSGKSISVLFIGNSFSYYHSLPKLVAHFAKTSGSGDMITDGVFLGGATLKMLWEDGRALKKLHSKKWDYVVLQERGRLGGIIQDGVVHVGKPKTFIAYVGKFDKEIKKSGAKTILYCPPSFIGVGLITDAKKLNKAYVALARKLHTMMIPSGKAFLLAIKDRPHIQLFEKDRHHPNPLGTYLIASLFYKKLFGGKLSSPPSESYVSRSREIPKNPKVVKISKTNSQFLWHTANRTK